MKEIIFESETPRLEFFKSKPDEIRVYMDTGRHQAGNVKEIVGLPRGIYIITIKPKGEKYRASE